jgi:hypothetical protein
MKTIKKVDVSFEFVDGELPFMDVEENKFYISKDKMRANHNCLCGCGGFVSIPIRSLRTAIFVKHEDNNGWDFAISEKGLTITPSILNCPCEGHYIVTGGVANLV